MKSLSIKGLGLLVLFSLIAIIHNSCKKSDLDLVPHGPTENNYFTQQSDFQKAVIGIYAKMDDFFWFDGADGCCGSTSSGNMIFLPGDDITCSDLNPFEIFGPIQPSNTIINNFYGTCYQMIARANVVLEKIAAVAPGVYTTAGLASNNKGEALFLRGFANYYLWNYYGTAPLDTVRVTSTSQFYPGNTTGNQLIDQAIQDFTDAAALLPVSWDPSNLGRVTQNAANGMLGKSLVFRGSWNKSTADFAAAQVAFSKITGVSLVPNFADNFAFDTENNSESLFEFQATQAQGFDNVWLSNDFDNNVGNASVYWGFYSGQQQFQQAVFVGSSKLAASFDPADPRLPLTIDSSNLVQKYVTRDALDQPGVGSLNNPRLLRYADILLLEAEATLQSGGSTSAAIGFINLVRQRARTMVPGGTVPADFNTTETDTGIIMQWIMDERLRELAGEGQRWFDLRRWNQQGLITLNNAFFAPLVPANMNYQPKNIYFPIPSGEISVNVNVKQNPGY
jgi:starch-binding outer membrane protein, SusD/RagB family